MVSASTANNTLATPSTIGCSPSMDKGSCNVMLKGELSEYESNADSARRGKKAAASVSFIIGGGLLAVGLGFIFWTIWMEISEKRELKAMKGGDPEGNASASVQR